MHFEREGERKRDRERKKRKKGRERKRERTDIERERGRYPHKITKAVNSYATKDVSSLPVDFLPLVIPAEERGSHRISLDGTLPIMNLSLRRH